MRGNDQITIWVVWCDGSWNFVTYYNDYWEFLDTNKPWELQGQLKRVGQFTFKKLDGHCVLDNGDLLVLTKNDEGCDTVYSYDISRELTLNRWLRPPICPRKTPWPLSFVVGTVLSSSYSERFYFGHSSGNEKDYHWTHFRRKWLMS